MVDERITLLEDVTRMAKAFVGQSKDVIWKRIDPPLGKGSGSIDVAYKNLVLSLVKLEGREREHEPTKLL